MMAEITEALESLGRRASERGGGALPGSREAKMPHRAEADLCALIDSTDDIIWSVDLEFRLTTFNRTVERYFRENFDVRVELGMRPEDLLPPARAARWPLLYERVLREGQVRIESIQADGSTSELTLNRVDIDGETVGISVFGKDVTNQKAAEKKYWDIFDGALEGIFQVSPESSPLRVNRAMARMLGYDSPEDLLSKVDNVAHQVWADEVERESHLRQLEEDGEVLGFECHFKRKDGSIIVVSLNTRKVCGSDGQLLCYEGFIIDITKRKRAEIALYESLESLKEAQAIGALGSYVLDVGSGWWSSSDVMDDIFGIGKDYDHTVAGWTALVHPADRAMMAAYFAEEVIGKSQAFNKEYRIVRQSDQVERWVHGRGRLEFNAQGQPVKMGGVIKDITERKLSELQLRESEERYRATFEQAPVGIVHSSSGGRIERCNARFAEIIGYPAGEVPGMTFEQLTPPEDMAETRAALAPLLRGEANSVSWEKRYIRKNGTLTWVRNTTTAQHDGGVSSDKHIAIVEDITERKRTEMQLQESEERYRSTFEQAGVGILHIAFDGKIVRCNARFAEIIGYTAEELSGMTFQQITAPEDIGSSLNVLEYMSSDTHNSSSWEKRYIRKDGTPVWVRVTISTLRDGEGRPLHYIALIEDIQARKAAEERLAATKEALQVSEERYRTVFQTSQDCISISHAEDGRFVDVNPTFLSMFGYEREEVIGRTALELNIWTGPEDRLKLVNALQGSVCRDISLQFARRNGERFWALLSGARIDLDGIPSFLLVVRDISDAKTAAEALRVSEERYRTAFQTSLDSININRLSDGMYIDCNQAFLDTLGYSREEVIGKTSLEMGVWADGRDRQNMVEMVRQQASCRGLEVQFRKKKGEYFWGQMSASPMEIDGVACILTVTRDLSQSKAAESEIRSLAFYDLLTGLPNRRLLLERLRQALAASGRSGHSQALLLVDLDNFKTLNETLGHETGDLLLQEAARRVVACAHEGDMVCRLGGDEFVVMLEDLSEVAEEAAAKARAVGEKILALVGQPYLIEERECRMTASIGITVFGNRENSTDAIMQQTDIALDQAKAAGRNSMRFFSPDLQAAVNARATLEEELRQAIKTQQFLLYYQPQVERGRLTGTEALIRWQHPRRGLVPPDEFIPLAEESRLILPLGDWVLQAACAQIALWAKRRNTAHLTLAVNISALQFRQPEFVETVLAALERTGANPKKLKLELTESILVENIEEVIIKMTELKSHGLSFSLDDFGTGYSSLAYLKRLPLDQLKIDRAFVRDMLVDATSGAIAQTILSLGDAMGLSVVAEGVESEEQRGFLAGLGCTSFQGYLFSRALPLDAFEAYLKGFNRPSARDRK